MKLKQGFRSIVVLVGLILISVQIVQAGVTVKYKVTSDHGAITQVTRYSDKQHVRQDVYDGNRLISSVLKLGDKVYMINDGQIIDIPAGLGGMSGALAGMLGGNQKPAPMRFKATGRSERIAGIKGKVYRVTQNGKSHEIVLGRNTDLLNAVKGSASLVKGLMGKSTASQVTKQINQDPALEGMAMLRFDHEIEVVSVKTGPISPSVFALPGK